MIKMKLGGYSILGIGLFVTNMLFASPAGIEQSLLNAEQVPPPATPPKPVKQPARPPRGRGCGGGPARPRRRRRGPIGTRRPR